MSRRSELIRKPYPTLRGIDRLDERQRDRLLALLKNGAPSHVLEARFGITHATIRKFARAHGIERTSASRRW